MKRQEHIPENDKEKPFFAGTRGKMISAMLMMVLVAVFMVSSLNGKNGSVDCAMDEKTIAVSCLSQPTVFIPYDQIESIELVTKIVMDRTISEVEWNNGWCGVYENSDMGEYTMFAYSDVGDFLVIRHQDGVLVFNQRTAKKTTEVYEKLETHIS